MAIFVNDTFTEATTIELSTHTGETGATWTEHGNYTGGNANIDATGDRVYTTTASTASYYASGTPAGAEYDIECDLYVHSNDVGSAGLAARVVTTENTMYFVRYNQSGAIWQLYKFEDDTAALLDSSTQTLTVAQTYAIKFEIRDATKKLFVDDVEVLSTTDNAITGAGLVGIRSAGARSATTGYHLDNFVATDAGGAATAGITGTATASIIESDVVTGGKAIIITLTDDTWKAAGTGPIGSTADTQALIDGLDSAQTETLGWNNEVRDNLATTTVVRTSATVATITLSAQSAYNITAQETITVTVPTAALTTGAAEIVATPTFTVTPDDAVPDAFNFTDQTDVALSTVITSAGIVVSGINVPAAVTCTGGTCSINGGTYSTSPGNCDNGDTITARHTSSASNSTATNTPVTIGGVSDTFTSTTLAANPTITLTDAFDNGSVLLASETGITAYVLNNTTRALIATITGLTTNASGVLSAISSASMSASTSYKVIVVFSGGLEAYIRTAATA